MVDLLLEILETVGYGDSFFYKLRKLINLNRFKLIFIGWDLKHFGLQIIYLGFTELFIIFHEGLNSIKVSCDFRMVILELIDNTFIQFSLVFHFFFNLIQYVSVLLNDVVILFLNLCQTLSLKNVCGNFDHLGITNLGPDLF